MTLLELYTEHATALARAAAAREMGEPTRVLEAAAETAEARLLAAIAEADARAAALVRLVAAEREVKAAHVAYVRAVEFELTGQEMGAARDRQKASHLERGAAWSDALALCPPEPATGGGE